MTLIFTQGHRVTGKVGLVQSSVVRLHRATQMLVTVNYVRKMTVKKPCKCSEYGSFKHLLFLF